MDISISLLFWGVLVGVVFSVIGAAGGILTSFGLITLVGMSDPNTVKPMAQMMTLAVAVVFFPAYIKRASCVVYLGLLLALGSVVGAWLGSTLSSHYLSDMGVFRPVFGVLALMVAAQVFWQTFTDSSAIKSPEVPTRLKHQPSNIGVHAVKISGGRLTFSYAQQQFDIAVITPVIAGMLVAIVAAVFGVGGGFLLVPFMVSVLGMPMYIVPATVAIPIFIGGSVSIANYMVLGAEPDYQVLAILVVGGIVGALLGPKLNQVMKESWLKLGLGFVVLLIGLKYIL